MAVLFKVCKQRVNNWNYRVSLTFYSKHTYIHNYLFRLSSVLEDKLGDVESFAAQKNMGKTYCSNWYPWKQCAFNRIDYKFHWTGKHNIQNNIYCLLLPTKIITTKQNSWWWHYLFLTFLLDNFIGQQLVGINLIGWYVGLIKHL